MKTGFWLLIMTVGVSCLVLLPNPKKTWKVLSDFMLCLLLLVLFVCWYWLSQAWVKIRSSVKSIIYTDGRNWLDETEIRITE